MDDRVLAALIGAGGILVGLLVRDVYLQLYLFHRKRQQELLDKQSEEGRANRDSTWQYSAPLFRTVESLVYRFKEIIDQGPATYLLADSPKSVYSDYKRISTLYRLSALLGWIRAYRKERSYLDPIHDTSPSEIEQLIGAVEGALADGQHVEAQRFQELVRLWCVPTNRLPDLETQNRIASELDMLPDEPLAAANKLSVAELHHTQQLALCKKCANLIVTRLKVDIPESIVVAEVKKAIAYLDIKEAYIYRDWQAAIGDLMLQSVTGAARRFDVIGFGEFEARYLAAKATTTGPDKLWFDRLESLLHGLDMQYEGIFDARREQVRKLSKAITDLKVALEKRLSM